MAVVGAINGLPGSTGTAVATNGVLVAIVQPRGLFIGHLASFVAYDDGVVVEKTGKVKKKETKTKAKTSIEEFV
ncbi:MAG: hypothetical protein KGL39_08560 [Patescibacteria group bacterium]|nr:hypothetical protein [Patescibacteria group bacterium]